jgi:HEPN domain-containing protein
MREEARKWLDQAEEDLDGAEFNFHGEKYYIAAFLCQQAVEKALKALLINETANFPKVHDLTRLARMVKAPKDIIALCSQISPAYTSSRYPDSPQEYSKRDCENLLEGTKGILKWVKTRLA